MNADSLEKIFNPRSVAYIGVSRREGKYKNWYLKSMFGSKYNGEIFLINPNATKLLGLNAYPNIKDVKEEIDLAVITLPAHYVLQSTKDCVKANVKAIIIITSGFAELGKEGEFEANPNMCIALDAIATPLHNMSMKTGLNKGENVAVFGVGGVASSLVSTAITFPALK